MRYKFLTLLLGLSLLLELTACGRDNTASGTSVQVSAEPETFGAESLEDKPAQMAQTTALPEGSQDSAAVPVPSASAAEPQAVQEAAAQDLTELAITSVVYCEYLDRLPYSSDPVFFWRSLGYLIDAVGDRSPLLTVEGEQTHLDSRDIEQFVDAIFADYTGDYPSVTEENPFFSFELGLESDLYTVQVPEISGIEITMTQPEDQGNGTFVVQAQVLEDGQAQQEYTVTMVTSVYDGDQAQLFPYSITGVTET